MEPTGLGTIAHLTLAGIALKAFSLARPALTIGASVPIELPLYRLHLFRCRRRSSRAKTGIGMIGAASFVGGDWGTSHLRLFLCDAPQGAVLDSPHGPGCGRCQRQFLRCALPVPRGTLGGFLGPLPVVLCGMVGSSIGWLQAPYIACPTMPERIADACVRRCAATAYTSFPGCRAATAWMHLISGAARRLRSWARCS